MERIGHCSVAMLKERRVWLLTLGHARERRANGRFEVNGMDRTRVRDGLVCENYVFFDSSEFQQVVGT